MDVIDGKNPGLVSHKGFLVIKGLHDPDAVDMIRNLEIKESDVLVVTYPKSGTIWMQQILLLLEAKGNLTAISKHITFSNAELVPWIEVQTEAFIKSRSPRMTVSHLPFSLLPSALSQKKGKVIYVARNPKDVLVSYFHFHKVGNMLETPTDFDDIFEKFMRGDVFASSWFEHIKAWYLHKDDINMLFLTYEEMVKDLHSAVERIALFLGSALTDEQLADVVKHATFNNMKKNPQANYERVPGRLLTPAPPSCHTQEGGGRHGGVVAPSATGRITSLWPRTRGLTTPSTERWQTFLWILSGTSKTLRDRLFVA